MIENERQYEVTKRNIGNFERAIADLDQNPGSTPLAMLRLMKSGYQEQLDKLRAELAEYERAYPVPRSA